MDGWLDGSATKSAFFFSSMPNSVGMDGWLDGSAPTSAAVFLNVYIADALGTFNWTAERMDGWPG